MKQPILILSLLSLFITACSPTTSTTKQVQLVGELENLLSDKVYLESTSDSTINLMATVQDSKFEFEFETEKPMWFHLRFTKDKCKSFIVSTELFLEPGDDIQLTGDAADFYRTIQAEGTGAAENNFLFAKFRIHYPECSGWPPSRNLAVEEYLSQLNTMRTTLADSLKYYNEGGVMNTHFVDFETRKDTYRWAYTKGTYPALYKDIHGAYPSDLPADYYAFLADVNYNDEEMYFSGINGKYVYLVNWYFDRQGEKGQTEAERTQKRHLAIEEKVSSQRIKDNLLADY